MANRRRLRSQNNTIGLQRTNRKKEDTETILTQKGIDLLKTINLTVRVPPELRAKRSVFIRQVDQSVSSRSEEEI